MSHCQSCGACCASFRVSFYWGETVPAHLTVPITPHRAAMRGTESRPVRCIALEGEVGKAVGCSIYGARSSTCRDFTEYTPECNKARAMHGLPAIAPTM